MNWLMKYGSRAFAVLTLLTAAWQTFGGAVTTLHVMTLVLAALTVLTLFLPQPPVNTSIDTVTTPRK